MPPGSIAWALGIACWLLGVNSLAVLAFHDDKRMAQQRGWRISEQTLLGIALLGGSPGALAARRAFRHKTRKQPFSALLYAICVLQVTALAWLLVIGPRMPPVAGTWAGAFTQR